MGNLLPFTAHSTHILEAQIHKRTITHQNRVSSYHICILQIIMDFNFHSNLLLFNTLKHIDTSLCLQIVNFFIFIIYYMCTFIIFKL